MTFWPISNGPSRKTAARPVAAALLAAGLILVGPCATPGFAKGTESLADLADSVLAAVVNISAAQVVDEDKTKPGAKSGPDIAPGTPYQDLFEQFFKRQLQDQNDAGKDDTPRSRRSASLGSGFIVDGSGIVITNNHVIEGANEITVILSTGEKLKAQVLGKDSKVDVAVLQVKPEKPLKSVPFGDSARMRVGDAVMAVGNPFGIGVTVTAGIVSARNRNIDSGPYDDYIQTDASINKGNSGGPLFNMSGEVIAINTAILSPSGGSIGIGFATPSATVIPIIDQLREFHEARRGWLGVRIQKVDASIADSLGLGTPRGALIAGVDENGPAKPGGLKPGDVIVGFDGKDIRDSRDLPRVVATTPVGKDVSVSVFRDGKAQELSVKVGRLEDGDKAAIPAVSPGAEPPKTPEPPKSAAQASFGMQLSLLSDEIRKKFGIKDGVNGVAITAVEPGSPAGDKAIAAGDVVMEINQEKVAEPGDVPAKIRTLKEAGKHSALLLVSNGKGEVRFVALGLD